MCGCVGMEGAGSNTGGTCSSNVSEEEEQQEKRRRLLQQHKHDPPFHAARPAPLLSLRPQTPTDKEWFQGTADAVRQYAWLLTDTKNRGIEDVVILSGDHL